MQGPNGNNLRTGGHAAFRLYYHVIFTTKYRRKCLTAPMLQRLEAIFEETLRKWRCRLLEFGGEAEHVHLLIDAHPALDLSRLIGNLKTVSSRRMRQEFASHLRLFYWKPLFWNSAYAIISVGGRAPLERLIEYIQDQETPSETPLD